MIRNWHCCLAAVVCIALGACDRTRSVIEIGGQAMGTTWSVQLISPPQDFDGDPLAHNIAAAIEDVENMASTYRPGSELTIFNAGQSTSWTPTSAELCKLLEFARDLSAETGGSYDITVAPLVDLWGFGPTQGSNAVPDSQSIDSALQLVGMDKFETDCSLPAVRKSIGTLTVDLSSSAKGYAVDVIANLLNQSDIENYIVEIGGELRMRGSNHERRKFAIAIENPAAKETIPSQVLRLTDAAVATSGDYRNFFTNANRRYSHILDPRTGYPVDHPLTSVTVIAASAMQADALATALLVMGPDKGFRYATDQGIAALFQVRDGDIIEQRLTHALKRVAQTESF